MATKTKTVYVRMPAELYQRLEDEAEARGETVSVVIRECTRKHLDALEIHDQPAENPVLAPVGYKEPISYKLHRRNK